MSTRPRLWRAVWTLSISALVLAAPAIVHRLQASEAPAVCTSGRAGAAASCHTLDNLRSSRLTTTVGS